MKKCIVCHTGVSEWGEGVIKDNKVYIKGKDDELYFPEEMFLAREECEGGLIQFEVEGKWGFANIYTGEMLIKPVWDYAGPFYSGYAHVALEIDMEFNGHTYIEISGGKHGYIDIHGNVIIPLEYDSAMDIPVKKCFQVSKNGKWGLIDNQNKTIIPLQWDNLETSCFGELIFCGREESCELFVGQEDRLLAAILKIEPQPTCTNTIKWGVYDQNFNLIVQPELDEKPINPVIKSNRRSKYCVYYHKHFALKKGNKFGILCNDGRLIANIELSKKQAVDMINEVSGRGKRDLYLRR